MFVRMIPPKNRSRALRREVQQFLRRKRPFFVLIFAALAFAGGCSTPTPRFERLQPRQPGIANLYILRPTVSALLLRTFDVTVLKYEKSFKDTAAPSKQRELALKANGYACFHLPPGFYRVELPGHENAATILHLDENSESFVEIVIYSVDYFAAPKIFLKQIKREDAVPRLLDQTRMERHPASED